VTVLAQRKRGAEEKLEVVLAALQAAGAAASS